MTPHNAAVICLLIGDWGMLFMGIGVGLAASDIPRWVAVMSFFGGLAVYAVSALVWRSQHYMVVKK